MAQLSADLATIVAKGNRSRTSVVFEQSLIVCRDGFSLSVIAGGGTYSTHDGDGYVTVEVGFPSERPEPWAAWETHAEDGSAPTETVYGWVPVAMVEGLIAAHGGAR